jgi:hypothetical protein
MSTENPILDALAVSLILNRKDKPGQVPWTEWRDEIVLVGGTPAQAGNLALLGPDGKFDPSVIPGGSGGSTVYVNGTLVNNPNFNNTTPAAPAGYANVFWVFDGSGNVSAYYATPQQPQTFIPVPHEWLTGYNATTGLFSASQPSASDLTNGTTGTGAVVLANSPTTTGTLQVSNVYVTGELLDGTGSPGTSGYILSSTATGVEWIPNTTGSTSFSAITSGTNTSATMIVGSGATLTFSGTGVVNANQIVGVAVTNTPTATNQVLVTTSTSTAQWQNAPSSSGNFLQALVDFGSDTGPITRVTDAAVFVPAPWVTSGSVILCTLAGATTPEHGPDDGLLEGMLVQAESLVAGIGFTIRAYSPLGSWGKYAVNAVGL